MATTPKRKRERRPPEVRREQILDAAARVFTQKGLPAATMDAVAAEAGVAKGTIYLYFASKEQLLFALGERYTEEVIQRSGSLLEGEDADESLMGRFDRFLEGMIDYYVERRDLHHVLFHGGAVSEAESLHRVRELLRRFIEEGVESGEFRVTDTGFTADFLLGGLHGALVPVLQEQASDRDRFLVPARELVRNTLDA
jgi:TetR/AcrR family transcriptional repressor of nem operon